MVPRNPLGADESGSTAVLEFTLVFPLFLLSAMVLVQIIFVMQGLIVVHHAAFCASRSAAVWSGQPGGHAQSEATKAARIGVLPVASRQGGRAVRLELLPLLAADSSSRGLGKQLVWLSHKYAWAEKATTVALSTARIGPAKSPFQSVTASVTHQFHLAVPYAGNLLAILVGGHFGGKPVLSMTASSTMLVEGKVRSRMEILP